MDNPIAAASLAAARGRRALTVPFPTPGAALLVAGLASLIAVRELHGAANFDEGIYLNSLRALQRGAVLGRQVFASQPPGFYLLLRLDAFLLPGSLAGLRLGFAVLGLAGCLSVFALGRLFSGVLAGTVAALLFVAASPVVGLTSRISSDLAAVSLSLVGIALLAQAWQGRARRRWLEFFGAFAGGAALAAATTIKVDGVFAVVAVCVLALVVRPRMRLLLAALGGFAVTLTCVLAPFADVAPQLWQSVVSFHFSARHARLAGGGGGLRTNFTHIAAAFEPRSNIVGWLMFVGALTLFVYGTRRNGRHLMWLLVWPLSAFSFLLWQTPLFTHHVVLLAGAAAVPAGVGFAYAGREASRRRRIVLAIAVAAVLAGYAESAVQSVPPEPAAISLAVSMLRSASRPGSYVVATDQPIVSFLAHRPVPAPLVDTSWVRLLSGSLTGREILAVAHADHVVAVLAGARLLSSAATRNGLHRLFPRRVHIASDSTLYLPAGRRSNR